VINCEFIFHDDDHGREDSGWICELPAVPRVGDFVLLPCDTGPWRNGKFSATHAVIAQVSWLLPGPGEEDEDEGGDDLENVDVVLHCTVAWDDESGDTPATDPEFPAATTPESPSL